MQDAQGLHPLCLVLLGLPERGDPTCPQEGPDACPEVPSSGHAQRGPLPGELSGQGQGSVSERHVGVALLEWHTVGGWAGARAAPLSPQGAGGARPGGEWALDPAGGAPAGTPSMGSSQGWTLLLAGGWAVRAEQGLEREEGEQEGHGRVALGSSSGGTVHGVGGLGYPLVGLSLKEARDRERAEGSKRGGALSASGTWRWPRWVWRTVGRSACHHQGQDRSCPSPADCPQMGLGTLCPEECHLEVPTDAHCHWCRWFPGRLSRGKICCKSRDESLSVQKSSPKEGRTRSSWTASRGSRAAHGDDRTGWPGPLAHHGAGRAGPGPSSGSRPSRAHRPGADPARSPEASRLSLAGPYWPQPSVVTPVGLLSKRFFRLPFLSWPCHPQPTGLC